MKPLGESKSDLDILTMLAPLLDMDDSLLQRGTPRDWVDHIIQDTGWTVEKLQKQGRPVVMHNYEPYVPGSYTAQGYHTPSGKFEIASGLVEQFSQGKGYSLIPTWEPPEAGPRPREYPLNLISGVRFSTALNSRLHHVEMLRDFRPEPLVELHPETAEELGVRDGMPVAVENELGRVVMRAKCTARVSPGDVYAFHGYEEADVNELFSNDALDPYTGFPAFRLTHCRVTPVQREENTHG